MTYSVNSHWHPLKTCVVGRGYPPEFFDYIKNKQVRSVMYRIAEETEQDLLRLQSALESFGVRVLRPEINPDRKYYWIDELQRYIKAPLCPRDHMLVIGDCIYNKWSEVEVDLAHYQNVSRLGWPDNPPKYISQLPPDIQYHMRNQLVMGYGIVESAKVFGSNFDNIINELKVAGNIIDYSEFYSANVMRLGRDLFFGTEEDHDDPLETLGRANQQFPSFRNHSIHTAGHSDSIYFPVCPGFIIATHDIPDFNQWFPNWEVLRIGYKDWSLNDPFQALYEKNRGRWWVPGEEYNSEFTDFVTNHLDNWIGNVEETVFDVNIVHIDEKNILVNLYNQDVVDAFAKRGITAHVVNLKHATFWDGGIHCCSLDISRIGPVEDYFSN